MTRRSPSSRELLLAAARHEFAAHGAGGARTEAIARRAGVNKQLLHYYFRTKAALYAATLDAAAADLAGRLTRIPLVGLTAVERLRRLLRAQFDLLAEQEELTRLLLRSDAGGAWADTAVTPVATLLTEGQATGFFRDDLDPLQHARQSLLLHLGYFALQPVTSTWGSRAQWRDRATELLVRGCTW
ncbi:MAG TPA: TetR family transcriptional regulator [Gemmatimonadales bacterium]|jgi:AcrR family transcriptional regulator|nr:TetR family transcriptional regulator [Gemmatimonadales bacterium]